MDDINRRFIETLTDEEKYDITIELIEEMSGTYSKQGNSICFIINDRFDFDTNKLEKGNIIKEILELKEEYPQTKEIKNKIQTLEQKLEKL